MATLVHNQSEGRDLSVLNALFISVVSTIPKIVCETLAALGLEEEIPSWKIMDNKGKITVVLHWEKEHPPGQPPNLQVSCFYNLFYIYIYGFEIFKRCEAYLSNKYFKPKP